MPRIDPLQLLKCLSVLLSPDGGILSRDEVPRLVNLMTKFSKKLVSKSIYVLILKSTETSLVDMFMAEGGWTLIQGWIQDAVVCNNWVLVKEILELLLITPVDVERLKINNLPKLVKSLSRRDDVEHVALLSDQIVQKWLMIVKGTSAAAQAQHQVDVSPQPQIPAAVIKTEPTETSIKVEPVEPKPDENADEIKPATFYKTSDSENKSVDKEPSDNKVDTPKDEPASTEKDTITDKAKADKPKKSDDKKSKRSKSSSSPKRDKDKDRRRSSHSSSKSSSSKDKDRKDREKTDKERDKSKDKDRKDRDKDKIRDKDKDRRGSSKSSSRRDSSSSHSKDKSKDKDRSRDRDKEKTKDPKEKQAEKDKETLAKIKPPTVDKLGRIPKKSAEDKLKEEDKKKPAFSILDKKKEGEERAKTVKVFNSKMRSTGLEEEAKPPPPRNALKKSTPSVQLPTIPQKRPSPIRDLATSVPPEKKIKIDKVDVPERPGAIKLIPPKPKPMLQESDMFSDALSAAVTKKPTKRKRRPSQSKDVPSSPSTGEANTPSSPTSSPNSKLNIAPINFYQDTLATTDETEPNSDESKESKENEKDAKIDVPTDDKPSDKEKEDANEQPASPGTPINEPEPEEEESLPKMPKLNAQGLKGVILYAKKKGPKRSIRWKAEEDLVEVRYFELDENERVNVTRTFTDMAKLEMTSEREALSRKPSFDDTMEPQTMWRLPMLCDQPEPPVVPGSKSLEKDIQFAREKSVLQALYFDKRRIPDSPEEPIPENHHMSDPVIIPLEDPDAQEYDLRSTPWPEPKGMPVMEQPIAPMFNQNVTFPPNFMAGPPQYSGMPPQRFPPPGPPAQKMPTMAGSFGPPMMQGANNMMPPPEMLNPAFMPGPPEGYPIPDGFPPGAPPFVGPPGGPNMFGPPGNFNNFRGPPRGGGGSFRRGGNNNQAGGGWVRLSGPPPNNNNWKRGGSGGRGHNNNRVCKNITNHGYCRNGDNCQWYHPK